MQLIFGFAFFVIGQPPILPSQPKHRLGVSYDKLNHQFGVSYFSLKKKKMFVKSEFGVAIFNLNDKNMQHERIENYYDVQKVYDCFICWFENRKPDIVVAGERVNIYKGYYPQVAIPISQTFYRHSKRDRRLVWGIGVGYVLAYTRGLKVSSNAVEVKVLDDTRRAEIVRLKQTVLTKKSSRVILGFFGELGLEIRIDKDYYLGFNTKFGGNLSPIKSSIYSASFTDFLLRNSFTLSRNF